MSVALIIALPDEAYGIENIKGVTTYISGVGKINSAIATFQAIKRGATKIINFGSAGLVSDVDIINKLIEPDIIIQRDLGSNQMVLSKRALRLVVRGMIVIWYSVLEEQEIVI